MMLNDESRAQIFRAHVVMLGLLLLWWLWPCPHDITCAMFLGCCPELLCTSACSEGWQITTTTFVGIANDLCSNCATYNATWINTLASGGAGPPCSRQSVTTDGPFENCNANGRFDTFSSTVNISAGNTVVQGSMNIAIGASGTDGANWKNAAAGTSLGTAPQVCDDSFPIDLPNFLDFASNTCDASASTCTLDFL